MSERQSWLLRFRKSPAHTQANIVCTAIIALATVIYTCVAGFQLVVMRGTLSEMKRSGKQSTDQMWSAISNVNWMARSADWAQKVTQKQASDTVSEMQKQTVAQQNTLTQARKASVASNQAFIATQRAYISPSVSFSFVPTATDPNRLESLMVIPVWTNSGDTPTREFISHGSDEWRSSDLPVDFKFPDRWSGNAPHINTRAVIGPKASATSYITTITLPVLELIADGKMRLFAYGWAKYKDIFPGTKQHISRYCFEVKVNRVSGGPAVGREIFGPTTSPCVNTNSNCTDEECNQK